MEAYLRTFLAVFKTGAINRAAALLHKSEPAVSYQIRSLEAACGKRLFDRVGRHIVPNQAGRFLYRAVEPMIGSLDAAVSSMIGDGGGLKSPVWVSSVSGFGRYVLAPAMSRIEGATFRLSFGTAEETWAAVKKGDADVGFSFKRTFDPWLEFAPVYDEEIVLVSSRPLRRLDFQALSEAPYITYEEGDWVFSKWFEDVWDRQPKHIRSVHHVDELEEVITFVRAGRALSIVPLDALLQPGSDKRLHIYRRKNRRCLNSVFCVQRSSGQLNSAVTALLQALRKGAGSNTTKN